MGLGVGVKGQSNFTSSVPACKLLRQKRGSKSRWGDTQLVGRLMVWHHTTVHRGNSEPLDSRTQILSDWTKFKIVAGGQVYTRSIIHTGPQKSAARISYLHRRCKLESQCLASGLCWLRHQIPALALWSSTEINLCQWELPYLTFKSSAFIVSFIFYKSWMMWICHYKLQR